MEWHGTFEIPETGRRVGGRLTIDAGTSILTTFGALTTAEGDPVTDLLDEDDRVLTMVWCFTEDGQRLTLLDLLSLGGSLGSVGNELATTRQDWIVGSAVAAQLEPTNPVTFASMSFGLTDLSAWMQSPRHEQDTRWDDPIIKLTATNKDSGELRVGDLTLSFGGALGTRTGFDSVTLDYPARIVGTPGREMRWEEIVNTVVTPIEALIWVATGRFNALIEPKVRLDGERPQYSRLWVSPLQPRGYVAPEHRLVESQMLFTAPEMPDGLEVGLTRWFGIWDQIRPAFGPVIARFRAPFTYSNDQFHAGVAGLESYSDQRHGPPGPCKRERRERRDRIRASMNASAPDLTEFVIDAVKEAERPRLRAGLTYLLEEAGEIGLALTGGDTGSFVSAVVKARHAFAHSTRIVGAIEGGPALHWTSRGLNWVLRYHALREIGFDAEAASERVLNNYVFKQEAQRLRDALGDPEASE